MNFLKKASKRTVTTAKVLAEGVAGIIEDVRENGDEALLRYSLKFDGCERAVLRVGKDEIDEAYQKIAKTDIADIRQAAENIRKFAEAQKETMTELPAFTPSPGVTLGHRVIPIESCCCYVPGGRYPLYSTALMLAIPAKAAGVRRVAACSPVAKGTQGVHPKTLIAMDVAGVDEIYAVGGAHAVAAFSYGTERIVPVDIIVGPGNSYVTEAKRQCCGQVGIDFIAGPSEVLVIADHTAEPRLIAADLLAQSEHDRFAQGIVVTTSEEIGRAIISEVEKQLETLETAETASQSWADYGEVIVVDTLDEAVSISNRIAPEHLEIQTEDSETLISGLYNYGSMFIGKNTAEVFGDYASGTNHTLPTLRAARYTGGVWVGTFLKVCTHQKFSRDAMNEIAPLVSRMARGEGLIAHARAAEIRKGS
ncbi:MAG: histidinol dehydrogenase [Synergistaceae bacterium]|jgi:histidinol dehydrogenase|nr:histidinol dehydrogenase [Synergistaceae bacterium]